MLAPLLGIKAKRLRAELLTTKSPARAPILAPGILASEIQLQSELNLARIKRIVTRGSNFAEG